MVIGMNGKCVCRFAIGVGLLLGVLLAGLPTVVMADLLATLSIQHDGKDRIYDLWVPADAGNEPLPLVVDIHGWRSRPSQQRDWSGYPLFADEERFFVAYPAGIDERWNPILGNDGEDDVGFILAMVGAITTDYAIDTDRIYVSGFSKGGDLTNRLACEASDLFAAFVVLAGTIVRGTEALCSPSRPVPILIFRGLNDNLLPHGGGQVEDPDFGVVDAMSAAEVFEFWRTTNGCGIERDIEELGTGTSCATARSCERGVQTTTCDIVGVTRPGTIPHIIYFNTDELNLGRIAWDFFKSTAPQGEGGPFMINPGLNDAWFNPNTAGQGFFINVFADTGVVFLAWFTYDTARPPNSVDAILGEPGHRWLTAVGNFEADKATLEVTNTTGGLFDSGEPEPVNNNDYGTIVLSFEDCATGLVEYDLPDAGVSGSIAIERVVQDNVALCEDLSGGVQ